jgi:hypothetical protein
MAKLIVRASLKFLRETDARVLTKVSLIAESINANLFSFPSVSPLPAEVIPTINAFKESIEQAYTGSKTAIANRNAYRIKITAIIRNWSPQITFDCNGDLTRLAQSGFDNVKQRTPAEIGIPHVPEVADGKCSGSAKLRVSPVRGAKLYQYRFTDKDPALATDDDYTLLAPSGTRTYTEGQTPGKNYFYSCRAAGPNGVSDWSGSAMHVVR